jgi:PIN domain nuclease of toxin-antitoxin system
MKALLDTNAFLWSVSEPGRLTRQARQIIEDAGNQIVMSHVSAWEIVIKFNLGKLKLPERPSKFIPQQLAIASMTMLSIDLRHIFKSTDLPLLHKDPFDRLLVAQALVEGIPIISSDAMLQRYDVDVIW